MIGGVIGIWGVNRGGESKGFLYSTGLRRVLGHPFYTPVHVRILDEVLLIIRKESGLSFDLKNKWWHLYGTDLCLEAERMGMKNYVLSCFGIHNSNGISVLPEEFWDASKYIRKKWLNRLPVKTPCVTIDRVGGALLKHRLKKTFQFTNSANKAGLRVCNPAEVYHSVFPESFT